MTLALVPFQHHAVMKWTNVHDSSPPSKINEIRTPSVPPGTVLKIRFLEARQRLSRGVTAIRKCGLRATFHCRLPQGPAGEIPLESALGGTCLVTPENHSGVTICYTYRVFSAECYDVILSYRDKRTRSFAEGKRVKAFGGIALGGDHGAHSNSSGRASCRAA